MSDPIRIPSCRGDGICPVCAAPALPLYTHVEPLPCGCVIGGPACASMGCRAQHLSDLLTEALRQRDECTGDALALLNRATAAEEERDTYRVKYEQLVASGRVCDREWADRTVARMLVLEEERDAALARAVADEGLLGECIAVLVALPGNVKADQVPALCGKIWKVLKEARNG